jgi:hypothetical protein
MKRYLGKLPRKAPLKAPGKIPSKVNAIRFFLAHRIVERGFQIFVLRPGLASIQLTGTRYTCPREGKHHTAARRHPQLPVNTTSAATAAQQSPRELESAQHCLPQVARGPGQPNDGSFLAVSAAFNQPANIPRRSHRYYNCMCRPGSEPGPFGRGERPVC